MKGNPFPCKTEDLKQDLKNVRYLDSQNLKKIYIFVPKLIRQE